MREKIYLDSQFENEENPRFIQQIINSQLVFSKELFISKKSKYGDSLWDWNDSTNMRLKCYRRSDLIIDWKQIKALYSITPAIIEDLKRYVFFRISHSFVVFPGTKKNAHPATIVNEIRELSELLRNLNTALSYRGISLIGNLADIEMQDLRDAFENSLLVKKSPLKIILTNLASGILSRQLSCGGVKWNKHDIATLPWRIPKQHEHYERLPERLFSFLSNNAAADVKQFLRALKIEPQDESSAGVETNVFLQAFDDFDYIFEKYVEYRNALIKNDKKSCNRFKTWAARAGVRVSRLIDLIERAVYAARIIIMLYTGARYSEFAGFKVDCLRRKGEFWVIAGTVIKHRDVNSPIEQDEWVAIPIVRDAIHVLQKTAQMVCATFLFHACVHASDERSTYICSDMVSLGVRKYIEIVDVNKDWREVRPHAQQFRNSLAYELRKSSLGLPFITYQLKHVYSAIQRTVNDTTLGYGGLGGNAVRKAIADANLLAFKEIYHPESPIAGGGAEQHRKRREAYFRGMAHRGMGVDEILRFLAKEGGMSLTDVGLGYCQGQSGKVVIDGVKTDPPCIGQLRCNPVSCPNAIIPKHKLPVWERSLEENQSRANNPDFAYAREDLLEASREAKSVVQFFQIKGRKRRNSV